MQVVERTRAHIGRRAGAIAAALRHGRLVAEREALAPAIPADPGFDYDEQRRVERLQTS